MAFPSSISLKHGRARHGGEEPSWRPLVWAKPRNSITTPPPSRPCQQRVKAFHSIPHYKAKIGVKNGLPGVGFKLLEPHRELSSAPEFRDSTMPLETRVSVSSGQWQCPGSCRVWMRTATGCYRSRLKYAATGKIKPAQGNLRRIQIPWVTSFLMITSQFGSWGTYYFS